jgi:hypothetical protein
MVPNNLWPAVVGGWQCFGEFTVVGKIPFQWVVTNILWESAKGLQNGFIGYYWPLEHLQEISFNMPSGNLLQVS